MSPAAFRRLDVGVPLPVHRHQARTLKVANAATALRQLRTYIMMRDLFVFRGTHDIFSETQLQARIDRDYDWFCQDDPSSADPPRSLNLRRLLALVRTQDLLHAHVSPTSQGSVGPRSLLEQIFRCATDTSALRPFPGRVCL